ncbi:translocation/assembly module TamB domain-containing protein [Aerosakkonema funiforme]|uniref:Translocation/assembly module TamB domain-containing protein n=2 Tax=Oscillatoriophycideae TaxID=1301283 RepID=A0A926ZI25_9CYAN|nr:translocation/assembly module TamB [Aerosakkonema funiforme]MBD2183953.1 translocation/assembly module TamB domain-containing protein [Aerosakkonema funiforme FACHB-1375]
MTNSPNPSNEPQSSANRRVWLLWLSRTGLAFGVILVVGVAAGAWWAWVFVQEQLGPLVEKNLSESLKRPLKLGKVERFSVSGLRFGASEIPATPTDPDRAAVGAIDVGFNPVTLLLNRTLELDLTLVNPDVYIEQDEKDSWIVTEISVGEGTGPFKTEIKSVRVSNAKVVLVPNPKTGFPRVPIGITPLNGNAQIEDRGQRIRFDLGGQLATGGNFNISGEHSIPLKQTNVQLQGQNLLVTDLDRLVKFSFNLSDGRADGNLTVRYSPEQPLFLSGTALLKDVTANLKQLPAPFNNTNGMLRFNDREITLDNVTTRLGQVPLQANGSFDLQKGYDITAQVPSVAIANIVQTLNLKTSLPVSGEVRAGVRLTGPIQAPILLGQFTTTKPTQVDKLQFSSIGARFALAPTTNELAIADLQAKPTVGGQITGKGNLKLGQEGGLVFDAEIQNVPGDAIAQQYGTTLSPSLKVGNVSAKAQVFGPLNDIRVVARWQAPQATYPAAGEVVIARGQTVLRDATFQVAGKTLQAAARIADGRWEALVEGSQLPVKDILAALPENPDEQENSPVRSQQSSIQNPKSQIPNPILEGTISGRTKLSGSLGSFKVQDIQAIAEGTLQVAGGNIQLRQAGLNNGRWEALVSATGIQLGRFPQVPPQLQNATFSNGQFKLTGNVESFQVADIQAIGQGNIQVAGGTVQIVRVGLRNGAWEAIARAANVNLGQLAQLPPQVQGPFNGQFRIAGNLNSGELGTIQAVGNGNIQVAGGRVQIQQLELDRGNWRTNLTASGVQLGRFAQVPPQLQGAFSGQVVAAGNLDTLTAQTDKSPLSQIQAIARGNLQVAGGNIQIRQAEIDRGNWRANVAVADVQLSRFAQLPPQLQGAFSGQFQLVGNLDALTEKSNQSPLSQIRARGDGNVRIAGGNVTVRQAQLDRGNFQAELIAKGVELSRFPQVPQQLQSSFSGQLEIAANLNNLTDKSNRSPLSQIRARGTGNLQVAGGSVNIRQAAISDGNWQANIIARGVNLARFPQVPKQLQSSFNGELEIAGNLDNINNDDNSLLSQIQGRGRGNLQVGGGSVNIRQAVINQGNFQADIAASNVRLNTFPQVPPQFRSSAFTGQLEIAGNLDALSDKNKSPLSQIQARGQGNLQVGGGNVNIRQAQIDRGNFQADIAASNVRLNTFPQVPPQFRSSAFTGEFQVAGNLDALSDKNKSPLSVLQGRGQGNLQVAGGSVNIRQVQIDRGNFQADIAASNVQLNRFPQVPKQFQGTFSGAAQIAGNLDALTDNSNKSPLSQIQAIGQGNLQLAAGNVTIRQAEINRGNWQANLSLSEIKLANFPQLPTQLRGSTFTGELQIAGNSDVLTAPPNNLPLSQIQASIQGNLQQVAGGSVTIRQAQLNRGNWQADVSLANVQLNRFSQQLQGRLTGDLNLAGNVASLTATGRSPLANIQARGNANFSEGIASIQGPIAATFDWNGQRLQIERVTAPGLNVSGIIIANIDRNNQPNITSLDINVEAQNLNLQNLPIQIPTPRNRVSMASRFGARDISRNPVSIIGSADFNGRISGTPTAPNVAGNLRLQNLVINGFDFDPVLSGEVQLAAGRGLRLNLSGAQDRIAVELDRNNNPVTFAIRRDEVVAEGRKQGDLLEVNVQNFPIATLKALAPYVATVPREIANQPISGILSGNFAINLNARSIVANNVTLAKAAIGEFQVDAISGDFSYANGIAEITNARLQKGESTYQVTGRITPRDFQASVQFEQGKVRNVLTAFNLLNLANTRRSQRNYAGSAALPTVAVGIPNASLLSQLRRFSEIEALLEQQRTIRRQSNRLPDITELDGNFSGTITVAGALTSGINSLPTGLQVSFEIGGKDWQWGEYKFNQVSAKGNFENGALRVAPLEIQYENARLAFSGNLGLQQQNGKLELQNFPVDVINKFVPLPVAVTGKLNGTANLAGTLQNPEVNGDLTLVDGTLNGTQVQSAQAIFTYENARLNFNSEAVVQQPQPIVISGSVPYQLPFATVRPDSNAISLDVNVQNEGLALLNLLSRGQVTWAGGQGQAQLQVRGTLSAPQITGTATVDNATIAAVALPAPLTDVTGIVRFDRDRILVENLTGNFSKGAVSAQGIIPISRQLSQQDPDRNNPLSVTLNELAINLKGLYRGGVNGNAVITGTAFEPQIGGEVTLKNGEVFLGQQQENPTPNASPSTGRGEGGGGIGFARSIVPEFNNLRLTLADNVNVTRPPLFSFRSTGELIVNGFLGNLEPQGTIQLRRGQVNLFTTQMTLDRDYTQTAVFVPERGLDPILDVRVVTTVPEVTGSRLPSSPISSEIADVPDAGFFGSVQTVRIVARVEGPASQLADNLVLTSNPPRTESEIVALIGGGFAQNLGRGDSTLGLANLAGSALLGNQQVQGTISAIGQAFGLSELRFFPTAIPPNREDRARNTTLGLAAEAVVDITDRLSGSVSKVLTTDQPLQYNLRYRVNNNILLRGSTDFSGDTKAQFEFERRF